MATVIRFFIPFLLWLIVFRDFFLHHNTINLDTFLTYALAKFFINNILNGIFPLWDPFVYLGTPFYAASILGFLNPLIYLVAILVKLGLNYYDAYLVYLTLSFFLGCVGFYFLSKVLLKDKFLAYLSFLSILFSGVGGSLFTQANMLLMFVPAVWFFYFLIRFTEDFRPGALLGLTFSAMIVMTSYIPLHFVTMVAVSILIFTCLNFQKTKAIVLGLCHFVKKNWIVSCLCGLALGVAFSPFVLYKLSEQKGEIVHPSRHCNYKNIQECFEATMKDGQKMSYFETAFAGSLGERVCVQDLFSHLDKISFGQDGFFYVPILCYLLIFLAAVAHFDRTVVLLLGVGVVILLIALGPASLFHRFLYEHIFYFSYFRNLFFFMVFLMPIVILLAFAQLKLFLEQKERSQNTRLPLPFILTITFLHLIFWAGLIKTGHIVVSSFVTVFLSLLLFVLYGLGYLKKDSPIFKGILVILVLMQPVEVFAFYNKNARRFQCELPRFSGEPGFSLRRPQGTLENACLVHRFSPFSRDFWYDMLMEDSSGSIGFPGQVNRDVFLLSLALDPSLFSGYVRNKFWLYTHVGAFPQNYQGWNHLQGTLQAQTDMAWVLDPDQSLLAAFPLEPFHSLSQASAVNQESEDFRVLHFDVNSLKFSTRFPLAKFLVYTDSFHTNWKLFINGTINRLYKVNGGFKGIGLPAGENIVELKYDPPGKNIYIFITAFFMLFMAGTMVILYRENRGLS